MRNLFIEELDDLEAQGLRRSLKTVASPQGNHIVLNGQKVINFSSNDYLGLANDERIKKAAIQAVAEYGFGSGASRLICGNMTAHEKLEEDLATFKNTEAALVFSSGYMANGGIISAVLDRHSIVFSDKLNHASIIDGIILSRAQLQRYPHADMQALEEMLKSHQDTKRKLIVTDTVFSMDGDRAPLEQIVELAQRYGAMVMVDEAHGFGVLGEHGAGLVEELKLGKHIDIQMGTLSKAAGCFGAYAAGTKILREYLINKSRSFIYTTSMPPAWAEAAQCALHIIRQEPQRRQRVMEYADFVRQQLKSLGFDTMDSTTPIIPILVKDPQKAIGMTEQLLQNNIYVQAIRPPTVPAGTSRLRLTVTARHTQEDLDQLLNAFKRM